VRRLPQLDGLRAFAFLAVFTHHALGLPLGWIGVDLFFVLSGFLITGILVREKGATRYFRTFYLRRFLRIFPPYYLFLTVALLVTGASFVPESWWYLLYLSNIRDSFTYPFASWLSPMWSLAVEEQFYLVWPLVVAGLSRQCLARFCLTLLVLAPAVRALLTLTFASFRPVYHLLPARMDLLAAGGLLALLQMGNRGRFQKMARIGPAVAAVATGTFALLAAMMPSFRTSANSFLFNTLGYSLVLIAMSGILAAVLGMKEGVVFRLLSNRAVIFLGTISYTLYLVHKLVLTAVRSVVPYPLPAAAVTLALTVVWASASWYLLEKPLARLKERLAPYSGRV